MLSVQTAGCAGMERLGVPTRTSLNAPPDDRGQYICRMHIDAARELLGVRNEPVIRGSSNHQQPIHHNSRDQQQQHHQQQTYNRHQQPQQHHSLSQRNSSSPTSPATTTIINATATSGINSINSSGSNNNASNNINNNSNNYNNNLPPMTNNTDGHSSGITKGANEVTAFVSLKHNNMCCGNSSSSGGGSGGGSVGGGHNQCLGSCNSIGSQCSVSSHSYDHHQHYQHQLQQQKTLCCPHHVPLPDSEWIPSDQRPAPLRNSYQHSELTRSYIKPPPNKTVKDVPDRSSYNFYSSSSTHSSHSGLHSLASSQSLPLSFSSNSSIGSGSSSVGSGSVAQPKSKPNVITKFFYRKSSPKSPNNITAAASSSSSSSSTSSVFPASSPSASLYSTLASSASIASSAASLLSSAGSTSSTMSLNSQASVNGPLVTMGPVPTLSVSTAATLKTTSCDLGPNMQHNSGTCINNISAALVPSTQLLTTIGVSHPTATTTFPQSVTMERIPTPPLSVSVPINVVAYQQQQKQQQHLLLDCLVGSDSPSVSSTLQNIKSSSCSPTLSATSNNVAAINSARDDFLHMDCQSGNITRNNSSSSMKSLTTTSCNCQKANCKHCNNDAATLSS